MSMPNRKPPEQRIEDLERELAELKRQFYEFRQQANPIVMMHTPLG